MLDLLDAPRFVEQKTLVRQGHRQPNWTQEEYEILEKLYPRAPKEEVLAALPGRNWGGIKVKATLRKIRRSLDVIEAVTGERWTESELSCLELFYPYAPRHVIEAIWPQHSWSSIQSAAHRQSITRCTGQYRLSLHERDTIKAINELGKVETMRRLPGLEWRFIQRRAQQMGVSMEYLPNKDMEILWDMFLKGYSSKDIQTMICVVPQAYGRALNHLKKKYNYLD